MHVNLNSPMDIVELLPSFTCHKKVKASKIIDVMGDQLKLEDLDFTISVGVDFLRRNNIQIGGYLVIYGGGEYMSYSPEEPFLDGYTRDNT